MIKRPHFVRSFALLFTASTLISAPLLTAAPPEIKAVGNHLENKAVPGTRIRLIGVNSPSLDWGNGENIPGSTTHILNVWKANAIRLCIDETRWLAGGSYQTTVDSVVNQASAANSYVIIDNHAGGRPSLNAAAFWTSVASRPLYKNNPAVLFGLFNEPSGITWDIWKNGDASGPGMQALLDAVRLTGANNLLVIGGTYYASDLSGITNPTYALADTASGNGILYDGHFYAWHSWTSWIQAARQVPLLLGECGHDGNTYRDGSGTTFGGNSPLIYWQMLGAADALGASYTPFSFHLSAAPTLITDGVYTPTAAAGQFVMNHIKSILDPAQESTVLNAGFETPVTTSFVYRPSGGTWTFLGNAGIQSTWNAPIEGAQTAFLQSATASDSGQNGVNGSMSQTFNFDVTGTYSVSMLLAQRSGKTELPIKVSVDGVPISSVAYTPGDAFGDNSFTPVVSAPFTINTAGNHTIKLEAVAATGIAAEALVDNVMVTATAPAIIRDQGFQRAFKNGNVAFSSGQFKYRPAGSSWTFSGNSGIEYNALSAPVAPEGRYPMAAFLQTAVGADTGGQDASVANGIDGSISATVEFAAPGAYAIDFKAATRTGKGNLGIKVSVDGALIGTVTPGTTSFAAFSTPAFPILTPGYHTVQFAATPSATLDNQAFIDAASVTVPANGFTKPIPLPIGDAGFESPSSPTITSVIAPTTTPWTVTGKCGFASDFNGIRNYDGHHAPEGWQTACYQGDGVTAPSISQSVSFPTAGNYVINFQAQAGRSGVVPLTITVDGVVVGTHTPPATAYYPYTTPAFNVVPGNHVIKIEGPATATGSGVFTLVDAINIWPIVAQTTLPSPWGNGDFGAVAMPGSSSYTSPTFTLVGSGWDLWGTADSFHYAYRPASGDCDITVRVATQTGGAASAKAAIMIRDQLTPESKNVSLQLLKNGYVSTCYRSTTGGTCAQSAAVVVPVGSYWLRLVRTGNTYTSYYSTDGAAWIQLGSPLTAVAMGTDVSLGLAVCAKNGATSTVTYDNVSLNP